MMGLPDGWVTGTDISRTAQLRAIGNGVIPQQGAHALRILAAEAPIPLPQQPISPPRHPDDGPGSDAAATPPPLAAYATGVAEWLHYRSPGQPEQGPAAYLHTYGGDRAEQEGGRAVPPGGSPRSAPGAARSSLSATGRAAIGEE